MADATSGGTGATGLPKGLSIDTTNGTITGSIDTSVTPGEYVAIITVTYSSKSKTEVSPSTVTYTHTFLVDQSTTPSLSNQATGVSTIPGLTLITSTEPQYLFTYSRNTTQTYASTYTSKSPSYSSYPVTITARLVYMLNLPVLLVTPGDTSPHVTQYYCVTCVSLLFMPHPWRRVQIGECLAKIGECLRVTCVSWLLATGGCSVFLSHSGCCSC
ncbi:putative Ig domain-containing protein [Tropheryma whipplei]|uniref:putative Ig domain-containing protein n=1 Tax=Tropheryma whipplei TaxID=2039 RepID=UPI0005A0A87C|nr:putative Ig domain-containing protein [Tropheryma whipplei]